jgi:hypothetical protein
MSRTSMIVALSCAFALGCVAASQAIVPAYAQQPNARKWQQFCSYRASAFFDPGKLNEDTNADLKAKGAEGWELAGVSIANGNVLEYCFKRPAP